MISIELLNKLYPEGDSKDLFLQAIRNERERYNKISTNNSFKKYFELPEEAKGDDYGKLKEEYFPYRLGISHKNRLKILKQLSEKHYSALTTKNKYAQRTHLESSLTYFKYFTDLDIFKDFIKEKILKNSYLINKSHNPLYIGHEKYDQKLWKLKDLKDKNFLVLNDIDGQNKPFITIEGRKIAIPEDKKMLSEKKFEQQKKNFFKLMKDKFASNTYFASKGYRLNYVLDNGKWIKLAIEANKKPLILSGPSGSALRILILHLMIVRENQNNRLIKWLETKINEYNYSNFEKSVIKEVLNYLKLSAEDKYLTPIRENKKKLKSVSVGMLDKIKKYLMIPYLHHSEFEIDAACWGIPELFEMDSSDFPFKYKVENDKLIRTL